MRRRRRSRKRMRRRRKEEKEEEEEEEEEKKTEEKQKKKEKKKKSMYSILFLPYISIISLYSIHQLVFLMEMRCVFCDVETKFLRTI
jgi:Na+/glutamate symporter